MARAPAMKRRRRGRRSMNINAGSVMTTLMTYWILADNRALLPVSPAIYMSISLAASFQGSKRRREADLKDVDNVVHHGIRSTELRPNMSEYTTMNSNNIPRVKNFHPGSTSVLTFKPRNLLVGEARNRYLCGTHSIFSRISVVCAMTIGSRLSPFACKRARISTASSHRSWVANHRGDLGIIGRKASRTIAGII